MAQTPNRVAKMQNTCDEQRGFDLPMDPAASAREARAAHLRANGIRPATKSLSRARPPLRAEQGRLARLFRRFFR